MNDLRCRPLWTIIPLAIVAANCASDGAGQSAPDASVDASLADAAAGDVAGPDGPASDGSTDAPSIQLRLGGVVQKGPFIRGTSITIQELNGALVPTGRTFTVETIDNLGHFDTPVTVSSDYVEIIASGYFFDEISGRLSVGQLTLRTISSLALAATINVNLLTSLAVGRERILVGGGMSFETARQQAETEILRALAFSTSATSTFDHMDVSHPGDDNGILLAASIAFDQLAHERDPASPVAELSQIIASVAQDIASDGRFDDSATASTLACVIPSRVDAASVRRGLEARFAMFDADAVVPAFESFLITAPGCCTRDRRQCSGDTAQRCDDIGRWIDTTCGATAPACKSGRCEPFCVPDTKRCDGNVAQVCDSAGRWQDGGTCDWGMPARLETEFGHSMSPQLAVDSSGALMASWVQSIEGRNSVRAARYVVGSGWDAAVTIDNSGGGGSAAVELVVAPSGRATAVFGQSALPASGSPSSLWSNQYDSSSGWQASPLPIDPHLGSNIEVFDAGQAADDVLALWTDTTSGPSRAMSSRLSTTAGWSSPEPLQSEPKDGATSTRPCIRGNSRGDAVALWSSAGGFVVANLYAAGSGWAGPHAVSNSIENRGDVAVAIDDLGNSLAVWAQEGAIWSNRHVIGAAWGTPQLLSKPGGQAMVPKVAVDAGGNALAVWSQREGKLSRIWADRYVAGRGWSAPEPIDQNTAVALFPHVVVDARGNATVAWHQGPDQQGTFTTSDIWIGRYTDGAGWEPARRIRSGGQVMALPKELVADPQGRVTMIWQEGTQARDDIWAVRFE